MEGRKLRVDLDHGRGGQPLYLQLANALQDFITLEKLKSGDVLPSETVLASENQLSRATVIKAFDTLVERGVVTRRQGKGTFVNARPMERELPGFTSFSDHVHGLGLTPGSSLIAFETIAAGSPDRPTTPFDESEELIVVERLRTVGDEVVGIHRNIVAADIADRIGFTERNAARSDFSFYRALRDGGFYLDSGEETLRAINADARDAELLGVDEGVALIEIVRASRDTTGRLVEVVRARYLGTKYLYTISFAPTSLGGTNEQTPRTGSRTGGGLAAASERVLDDRGGLVE